MRPIHKRRQKRERHTDKQGHNTPICSNMDWAWGGKIVAYFFVFVVVIMCSSPVMGDLYLYSLWVNLNTHRVESQLYLYNSHNGLLVYCSRVYDIAGSFLLENQTWLAMMLLEKKNSPLYLFPPALAFCFGTVFHVFLNMENAYSKVDLRIWNVKQPASICVHLGFRKNQFQALKEFGTRNQCCSLRNEFYFIFACRNKKYGKTLKTWFCTTSSTGFCTWGAHPSKWLWNLCTRQIKSTRTHVTKEHNNKDTTTQS